MASDEVERLVVVARGWERINADQQVEIAELKRDVIYLHAENARLRALVSWVHGMLLDDADPAAIRAQIDAYWKRPAAAVEGREPT